MILENLKPNNNGVKTSNSINIYLVGSIGDLGGVRSFNSWKLFALDNLSDLVLLIDDFETSCLGFTFSSLWLRRADLALFMLRVDSAEGGLTFLEVTIGFGVCLITMTPFLFAFNAKGLVL